VGFVSEQGYVACMAKFAQSCAKRKSGLAGTDNNCLPRCRVTHDVSLTLSNRKYQSGTVFRLAAMSKTAGVSGKQAVHGRQDTKNFAGRQAQAYLLAAARAGAAIVLRNADSLCVG